MQSLQTQLGINGAGDSSAVQQGDYAIQQSFASKFADLKQNLNSELASIDCPST